MRADAHPHAGGRALRRDIYYFHGFDPAPTARYRGIFEAASARLGVSVSDLDDGDGWVARRDDAENRFHYLRYEDLVREAQRGGVLARLGRGLRTLAGYVTEGATARIGVRPLTLMFSPYPVAFAPLIFAAGLSGPLWPLNAGLLALSTAIAWALLFRMRMILVPDLFAYMRTLARGVEEPAEVYSVRVADLSARIGTEGDETLVVGHSLGGIAAILAVAEALDRLGPEGRLSLLTLGSTHGIVLAQKGEGRDRLAEAIARIARDARVFWVDVSSPRDAFCVPLTDPLLLIGEQARAGMTSPRVISAPLSRAPRIPGDRRTLFPAMRMHMGYLLGESSGAGFDYSEITTGAQTLAERYAERGNSPRARMWRG